MNGVVVSAELDTPQARRPADCPVEEWLAFLGHRWNALVLWHLKAGAKRHGELAELLPKVSPKVLSERLEAGETWSDPAHAGGNLSAHGALCPVGARRHAGRDPRPNRAVVAHARLSAVRQPPSSRAARIPPRRPAPDPSVQGDVQRGAGPVSCPGRAKREPGPRSGKTRGCDGPRLSSASP